MKQYEMFEMKFQGREPLSLACPDLKVTFTLEKEKTTVKGFYDGNGVYKVRFLPMKAGTYHWKAVGEITEEGTEICEKADATEHGPVQARKTHFIYADQTPYIPIGTTIYAMAHQSEELINKTLDTLSKSCFNKVRLCLFPKSYEYNQNEPKYFPFEKKEGKWEVTKPVKSYWDNVERIIENLGKMKIQADVILFHSYDRWGFASLTKKECKIYLDTVVRHLAAYPHVWWSLANEYDLMFGRTTRDWKAFGKYLKQNDPYGHLRSNHNAFRIYNDKNMTHICVQSSHLGRGMLYVNKYKKPVIFDECAYEGNLPQIWGCITGRELVNRFWLAAASGVYCSHGETFLDQEDVIWWAKGGVLKGNSEPRIAWLKAILQELDGSLEYYELPPGKEVLSIPEKKGGIFRRMEIGMSRLHFYSFFLKESTKYQIAEEVAGKISHIGEDVYLIYHGRNCPGYMEFYLPETHKYQVEVLDTWEMKRHTVFSEASGKIKIPLPSKGGMAVLIKRRKQRDR